MKYSFTYCWVLTQGPLLIICNKVKSIFFSFQWYWKSRYWFEGIWHMDLIQFRLNWLDCKDKPESGQTHKSSLVKTTAEYKPAVLSAAAEGIIMLNAAPAAHRDAVFHDLSSQPTHHRLTPGAHCGSWRLRPRTGLCPSSSPAHWKRRSREHTQDRVI